MTKAPPSQTKYASSLNNLLYDAVVQLLTQDNINEQIANSLQTLSSIFELTNVFFVLYDAENKPLIQSKVNDEIILEFFEDIDKGIIQFEQLEAGALAIRNEYIAMPIFLKGKLIGTLILVKEHLIRYVDPDYLLLYSQLFSSVLSNFQSTEDLAEHNKKLLEKEKLKNELLSTVSHELKTPMSSILGFSELLEAQELDKDTQKQYQSEIHKSAKRLSSLITNFLDLSRIESMGSLQLNNFEEAEIDWLAQEAWNHLKAINSKHKITWEGAENLPEIFCDNESLTRVFINLFSNAIKYSPIKEDSPERANINCKFTVCHHEEGEARRDDLPKDYLLISISDHGMGLKEDEITKVFDRFYRSEAAQKKLINGTGLGLWICKEIITAHEGKIWCDSKIAKGTSFHISLPLGNNIKND